MSNDISPSHQQCFDALRAKIATLSPGHEGVHWLEQLPDWALMRYVVGHKGNVKDAWDMLLKTAAWRVEYKMDTFPQDYAAEQTPAAKFLKSYFPMLHLGRDAQGRPINLFRQGMVDYVGLEREFGMEPVVRHMIWVLEMNLLQSPNKRAILLVDLGYNDHEAKLVSSMAKISSWTTANLHYLKAMVPYTSPAYPETHDKIIFIRTPSVFWAGWNVVKHFLPEVTRKKVRVMSDAKLTELEKHVPLHCIPDYLGGGASTSTLNKGGIVETGTILCDERSPIRVATGL